MDAVKQINIILLKMSIIEYNRKLSELLQFSVIINICISTVVRVEKMH